jgi:hypothetical protein
MHNLSQADFRHNFFTLKTPQNMYPSWRKNRTESHFSKPNFDMQRPNCCKSYNVYGDLQIFNFLLVQKNIYSLSPLCTRSLTSAQAEIGFFNSSDSGSRTKGPNLGRLTVYSYVRTYVCMVSSQLYFGGWLENRAASSECKTKWLGAYSYPTRPAYQPDMAADTATPLVLYIVHCVLCTHRKKVRELQDSNMNSKLFVCYCV